MKFLLALLVLSATACGSNKAYIANTTVEDNKLNRDVVATVEEYRRALERRDAGKLLLLASKKYWDDAGTPDGADDYGYTQLKDILSQRLQRAKDIRYSLRYKQVRTRGDQAFVDVLVDASYTITDAAGADARKNMRDRNRFVLERDGNEWRFISGM